MTHHKKKMSDIMAKSNYVFVSKISFSERFPQIESIIITVENQELGGWANPRNFGVMDIGEYIDCIRDGCYEGGINVANKISQMVNDQQEEKSFADCCRGNIGSHVKKSEKKLCSAPYRVTIKIVYKDGIIE